MQLLPNEERIVSSNDDKIILTNQRIQQSDKQWGRSFQLTIFLENISSIELQYKSNPILLALAVLGCIAGIASTSDRDSSLSFGCFIFAAVLAVLWLLSKNRTVTIASHGGTKLNFKVEGMSSEAVEDFVEKLILAQALRSENFQTIQHKN